MAELTRIYTDRAAAARGGPVYGYVGADVPVEQLTAAGVLPVRLWGDPAGDTAPGDRYLGKGLDPVARSVLTRLLAGAYGTLDRVVVSRDCEASLRLFYALRELRRVEPELDLPEPYLVDVLHLPHRTTTRYVRARLEQFRDRLHDWTGTTADLPGAIARHDEQRRLLAEAAELRRAVPARLTGTEFLAVAGAGTVLPVTEHLDLLRRLLAEAADLPEHTGRRIFLTGSGHDTPEVYRALEGAGHLVVGEDHDWGDLLHLRQVGTGTLTALAERYQHNGPTAQRATTRARAAHTAAAARACRAEALVGYARRGDEAPPWDFPAQRAALPELPAALLERQEYGRIDLEGIR
ncbi:2-hydroxyacyl-CoA dehydratase [Actinomadura craniellae]|uniref:2-hydroxyacyl-CoA dehydratase n=1 Tax=Actinomadura craniellae TaxID=2231787 RepID=A0A365HAH5_9ACTN|nr:2-hydroxyacyl-CoA dehydratase [Actinomadura craniellae]